MARKYRPMTSRWTPASALRRMEARIKDASEALIDIAAVWGDADQAVVDEVDRLIVELNQLLADQRECVRERLEAGEYVGP